MDVVWEKLKLLLRHNHRHHLLLISLFRSSCWRFCACSEIWWSSVFSRATGTSWGSSPASKTQTDLCTAQTHICVTANNTKTELFVCAASSWPQLSICLLRSTRTSRRQTLTSRYVTQYEPKTWHSSRQQNSDEVQTPTSIYMIETLIRNHKVERQ